MLRAVIMFYRRKKNKKKNEGRSRYVMCDKDREGTEKI